LTRWNDFPDVRSPNGVLLSDLLEEGPTRQELPGYDPIYQDFVDYILRCTHRIWEQKNVGLCRTHYAEDCRIHTLGGPIFGVENVVQNTVSTLGSTPDRRLIGEDVIWSDDGIEGHYSSHRIVSRSVHLGDDPLLGSATTIGGGVMTIADCLCRENRIVEEWLVRDNLRAVLQVGSDPWTVAQAQAAADQVGDTSRHQWRSDWIATTQGQIDVEIPDGHPAAIAADMLAAAWRNALFGEAAGALAETCEIRWPSNRKGVGRGYWIGCLMQIRGALHDTSFRIEHIAARPLHDGSIAVALRWSLAGKHKGIGIWGPPSGRDVLICAVSHYRLRDLSIIEDVTVFDELAVLRQVNGGLSV
jgi:predicted ester cyclase